MKLVRGGLDAVHQSVVSKLARHSRRSNRVVQHIASLGRIRTPTL
jgi:hypothetical protein